jgi:hypothetical protein
MRHRQHRHVTGIPAAAILLAGLVALSCGHKRPPGAGNSANASGANDQKIVDLMESKRERALKNPSGAVEAADFAYNVSQLYTQGVTERRSIEPGLLDEAERCLDEARMAHPDKAADLLARKGEMLLSADKYEAGVAALRLSMSDRPNLRAFKPLIKHYADTKATAEAEALCKQALPAMKSDGSRYLVLDECLKLSDDASPEVGLKWAGRKEINFYKTRKRELDAIAKKAKE